MTIPLSARPRLITWVERANSIADLHAVSAYQGCAVAARQRHHLRWQSSRTRDGTLLGGVLLPFVIQWDEFVHPADSLPNVGYIFCGLKGVSRHTIKTKKTLSLLGLTDSL